MDEDDEQEPKEKTWFPLESNPDLLNWYVTKLGFDASKHQFVDVFSTEPWALDMIPQPVSSVVVLFPATDKVQAKREGMRSETTRRVGDRVWYMRQRIRNACGTVAILHALANAPPSVRDGAVTAPSWLASFLEGCPASSSPEEKAEAVENDADLESYHERASDALINRTSRGAPGDELDMHFVAFAHVGGKLYELDGRVEQGAVCHGDTTQENLLKDACGVVKQLMEADPNEMRFTIIALAPTET